MKVAREKEDGIPPMKKAVEELLTQGCSIPLAVTDSVLDSMSELDTKVLKLWLLEGLPNDELGGRLNITARAVREHKLRFLDRFSYQIDARRYSNNKPEAFVMWAKESLVNELERLWKVGVEC